MKENLTFKPFDFTDAEYSAYAKIWNSYYPDEIFAPEEIRHDDESRDEKYLFQRFTVFEDEKIIGFCSYRETSVEHEPGRLHVAIYLSLDHLKDEYQTALYEFILTQIKPLNPAKLVSMAREDKDERVAFYLRQGFKQTMRSPRSILDLDKFDETKFASLLGKLEREGIALVSLAEIATCDPEWIAKWREIEWEVLQDVPSTMPHEKQSLEFYRKQPSYPGFYPEGCFFALDGSEMIALSFLWRTEVDNRFAYTGLTGVSRKYRRRGIATALKVKAIEVAKADGFESIETSNEENNPMYQLNLQLGYEPAPAWLEFEKRL
jgi:GNAT superfamily N-acetyltransferase